MNFEQKWQLWPKNVICQILQSSNNFFISTIGDHNGKIRIKSNKKLKGSISTNVHNFLQSEEADLNLENKNLEVNLMVDCKITPEVRKKLMRFSKVSLLNPGQLKLLWLLKILF